VLNEIRIHQLVEERRKANPDMCRHLVRFRSHRIWMMQRRYRIYLDHYAGGNLSDLVYHHKDHLRENPLSEDFLWYMLASLVSACLIFHRGTTGDEPLEGWRPITHLDLKPMNIFLGLRKRKRDEEEEMEYQGKGQMGPASKKSKKTLGKDKNEDTSGPGTGTYPNWKVSCKLS
jgi:serine/threonine protein kinase